MNFGFTEADVHQLSKNGTIPRHFAERIIKKAAYWYKHPSGYPVAAPGYADKIELCKFPDTFSRSSIYSFGYDETQLKDTEIYYLELGANAFLINLAVIRSQHFLLEAFRQHQETELSNEIIHEWLEGIIQSCVVRHNNSLYDSYPWDGEYMHFGSQALRVKSIVTSILQECQTFHFLQKHQQPKSEHAA